MISKRKKTTQVSQPFSEINQQDINRFWAKKGTIIATVFSTIWVVFAADYLAASGWWAGRVDLAPAEFIGGISGLLLPIVVAWLVCAYFDRSEQLKQEANTLKSYLNELVYPSAEGAVYTQTLTEALRTQIKEFRSVFNEVNEQTTSVRNDLKDWIGGLNKIITHVDTHTVSAVKEMAEHIRGLAEATEIANERAGKASAVFVEQAKILEQVGGKVSHDVMQLSTTMVMNLEDLRNTAHAIENVNERSEKAVQNTAQVSGMMEGQVKKIENAVQVYETSAKQQNARLFGNLEKVLSVFRAQGDLLDQEIEKTTGKLLVAEKMFVEKTRKMFETSDEAIFRLTDASALFDKKAQNVAELLSQAKDEFKSVMDLKPVGGFKPLPTSPKNLGEERGKSNDFLGQAQVILDRLQTFSVDMAHVWTPKQEEDLWKRYHAGDKSAFMRHVSKTVSGAKAKKIQELYNKDKAFKIAVSRYMAEFEGLTASARKQGDNGLLIGTLVGSDVGKLYMVLANTLKGKK